MERVWSSRLFWHLVGVGGGAFILGVWMKVRPDETGVVRVRGTWSGRCDHIQLPDCRECGKTQWWYFSDLPEDWREQEVLVTVRLAPSKE